MTIGARAGDAIVPEEVDVQEKETTLRVVKPKFGQNKAHVRPDPRNKLVRAMARVQIRSEVFDNAFATLFKNLCKRIDDIGTKVSLNFSHIVFNNRFRETFLLLSEKPVSKGRREVIGEFFGQVLKTRLKFGQIFAET